MLGYSQEPTPTFGGLSMEETFLSYSEKMGKLVGSLDIKAHKDFLKSDMVIAPDPKR